MACTRALVTDEEVARATPQSNYATPGWVTVDCRAVCTTWGSGAVAMLSADKADAAAELSGTAPVQVAGRRGAARDVVGT